MKKIFRKENLYLIFSNLYIVPCIYIYICVVYKFWMKFRNKQEI